MPSLRLKLWGSSIATWRVSWPLLRSSSSDSQGQSASARRLHTRSSGISESSRGSSLARGQSKLSSRLPLCSSSASGSSENQGSSGARLRSSTCCCAINTGPAEDKAAAGNAARP